MYQPMLFIHWKQIRLALIPLVVAAFGLPLLSVQGLGGVIGSGREIYRALAAADLWLPLFPVLAIGTGVALGLSAWSWDHQYKHVYSLALPLARWEYVLLKMGAGMALALVPTAAFWVGARLASASIDLPTGLHAYPDQLTLRFLLALLVSYAASFAAAAGTVRTATIAATALIVGPIALGAGGEMLVPLVPGLEHVDLMAWTMTRLVESPGPFAVFTGNWSLIDV